MTYQPAESPKIPEIEVTPEMVAAGVAELAEHRLTDDWGYIVESVYRAMAYASAAASSTSARA